MSPKSQQKSIQHALNDFFKNEILTDFKCEKCQEIKEVLIKRKFTKLPRVLILHLKRYQFHEKTNSAGACSSSSAEQLYNQEEKSESTGPSYRLIKNESIIKIPRYLSLHNLLTDSESLKLPKRIDKKLFSEFSSKRLVDSYSESNPNSNSTPFGSRFSNSSNFSSGAKKQLFVGNASKSNVLSKRDENVNIRNSNGNQNLQPTKLPNIDLVKGLTNSLSPLGKNYKIPQKKKTDYTVMTEDDEELPTLDIQEPFDDKHGYNLSDFSKKDMTEEQQLKLALEQSKRETSTTNITEKFFCLDGTFDDNENRGDKLQATDFLSSKSKLCNLFFFINIYIIYSLFPVIEKNEN